MVAVAAPVVVRDERAGYVDGYTAALDAFAVVLSEPGITPGDAMKRVEDHLLYRLDPWIDDLDDALLPVFDGEAGAPTQASREYRYAYMNGWDDAILAMAILLEGHGLPGGRALARAYQHVEKCLVAWRDRPTFVTPKPPQLEHLAPC